MHTKTKPWPWPWRRSSPSSACTPAVAPSASARGLAAARVARRRPAREPSAPAASPSAAPLAVDPAEAVIPNVEAERRDRPLDVLPVADLRRVHQGHDRPLRGDVSRRQGQLGRPPGARSRTTSTTRSPRATPPTSSTCRSVRAGSRTTPPAASSWTSTRRFPQEVKDIYFEGLWKSQLVDGKNFQFPWYQGIAVELINKRIYEEGAGLAVADFPKTVEACRPSARPSRTRPASLCDIRLTVNDLLAQMVYEGDVDVIAADGKSLHLRLRPRASSGSRCTSTWSRPAPSIPPR